MQAVLLTLIADSLMAFLLMVTIVYCFKLNRRIRVLQDSKSEFSRLIERFDNVTQRAQESITELQNIGQKVDEKLSGKLDKANFLADDLAFMIEKGNKVATRASDALSSSPKPVMTQSAVKRPVATADEKISASTLAAKEKMMAASDPKNRRQSIEAVMERISSNKGPLADNSASAAKGRRTARTHARLRSRAEQELQDAMKSSS